MAGRWRARAGAALVAVALLGGCAAGGSDDTGTGPPAAVEAADGPIRGCALGAGTVSEAVGFAVERVGAARGGRCEFAAVDQDAHPGAVVELLVLNDPGAVREVRAEVLERTGLPTAPAIVGGADQAFELRLGAAAQVGAVSATRGAVVTVAGHDQGIDAAATAASRLATACLTA